MFTRVLLVRPENYYLFHPPSDSVFRAGRPLKLDALGIALFVLSYARPSLPGVGWCKF